MTEFRHQIHGPTGPIAIYTRRSSGTADTYYLHRDHLGSPELVTNAAGAQVAKLSFGAFGERRGSNWTGTPSSGDWTAIGNTTRDGFTDHEHLDAVGLVHMNGRVYDPRIGRFLSPDPFIDCGLGSQGVNRYGYVGNNPLRRIDPSGYTAFEMEELFVRSTRIDAGGGGGWTPFGQFWGLVSGSSARQGGHEHFSADPANEQEAGADREPAADAGAPDPMKDNGGNDTCVDRCRTRLEPAVQGAAGAAGGGVAGLVAGLRTPGAGTVALGLTGALAGGLTGFVTGSTAAGGASPATSAGVGATYGGAAAMVGMMLTGRAPSLAGVLGGMWSGTVGGAAPTGALGAASSTGGGAAVGSMAANGPLATLIFASSAGGTAAYLTYRFADGIANRYCEGQCGK